MTAVIPCKLTVQNILPQTFVYVQCICSEPADTLQLIVFWYLGRYL
jgi:hypothetical protein